MARVPLVDFDGNPTGELIERSRIHKRGKDLEATLSELHGQGHVIIFDRRGRVLTAKRDRKKMFLPGVWLPLHGGHIDEKDLRDSKALRREGYDQREFLYLLGAAREASEETGLEINPYNLTEIDRRKLDLTGISGFTNYLHIRTYAMTYDRKKHGKLRPNKREVEEAKWRKPIHIVEDRMLVSLGSDNKGSYGRAVQDAIERISKEIRMANWYLNTKDRVYETIGRIANADLFKLLKTTLKRGLF